MSTNDWFPENIDPATYDPVRSARGAMKTTLPKRFYKEASVSESEHGFQLLLDGRPARTPARNPLALPTFTAAELLAAEWAAQEQEINPAAMPITRIAHVALDHVANKMAEVSADIAKYAGSDLLFYRAEEPQRLVERQKELWDPVLRWIEERFDAPFRTSNGIVFVSQPADSIARIEATIAEIKSPAALAALHVMTTLTGSILLALAVAHRQIDVDAAFTAAELDADTQRELWGADAEAVAARANRDRDNQAAAALYLALS